jgi:hypothetical protein
MDSGLFGPSCRVGPIDPQNRTEGRCVLRWTAIRGTKQDSAFPPKGGFRCPLASFDRHRRFRRKRRYGMAGRSGSSAEARDGGSGALRRSCRRHAASARISAAIPVATPTASATEPGLPAIRRTAQTTSAISAYAPYGGAAPSLVRRRRGSPRGEGERAAPGVGPFAVAYRELEGPRQRRRHPFPRCPNHATHITNAPNWALPLLGQSMNNVLRSYS